MLLKTAPFLFVFLWSTGFVGAKFGLPYAAPLSFLLVRYCLVIGLMATLALAMRAPWPRDPRHWLHIGVSGVLVHALYLGGVFVAIKHGLPAGITALLVGMQPLLTAFGAGIFLGETVTRRQWLGLALGFVGVFLVVAGKFGGDAPLLAMLLPAVVALLGITAGTLYQKRHLSTMNLITGSAVQFAACALLYLPLALVFEKMAVAWTKEFVAALAWLSVVLSIGAISLFHLLIRRGAAARVTSLFYLVPSVTAAIAYVLFGEQLGVFAVAGMVVAAGGVALATRA